MLSIFAIGSGLTYYLGRMVEEPEARLGRVGGDVGRCSSAGCSSAGGRRPRAIRFTSSSASLPADGNMEGKEVRFGIFNSALFATITTDASCGAVNSMHDSFTALGGLVPLFNIQLGEVIFGGVGAGLYGMLVFVVLAVFIAGLMVGRTPEYLGKKIEAYDVKMAMLALLMLCLLHPRLHRLGRGERVGPGRPEQSGPARLERDPLRLQLRHRQQRQRLRRPDRQHALV